jgi:Mechanosensitive ion channel, conserved TM helix
MGTMREMIISELSLALHELKGGFAHFLPRLIVMLILAFLGWMVASVAKVVLRSILRFIKFDKLSENAGASQLLTKAALPSATEVLSRFLFWVVWLGFILLGVSVLGIPGLQEQIARFFLFLPRLFVAVFILFFGLLAASFFSRATLLAAVNANVPSPRVISLAVRSIIVVFVLSIVFEELGLAGETMLLAFGIVFGAMMLGLAIAFGLGGRELAQRFLERKFVRDKKEENEDELSPL